MNICSNGHSEIVYTDWTCPLCGLQKTLHSYGPNMNNSSANSTQPRQSYLLITENANIIVQS